MNNKGQALIEATLSLPLIISIFTGLLVCCYTVLSFYLVDHWTYESNLCLARSENSMICKQQLKQRLSNIPFTQFKILSFFRGEQFTRVHIKTKKTSLLKMNLRDSLKLPLNSKDFNRFDN